jgi:predicted membrane chloride channel (bestrophin family)
MRVQGSVMPQMILPLLLVGGWATAITCFSHFKHNRMSGFFWISDGLRLTELGIVGINNILLTVLGFVVGLSLSFRGSTAYERYSFRSKRPGCT